MVFFSCSRSGIVDSMSVTLGSCLTCLPSPDPFTPLDGWPLGAWPLRAWPLMPLARPFWGSSASCLAFSSARALSRFSRRARRYSLGKTWTVSGGKQPVLFTYIVLQHIFNKCWCFFLSCFLWFKWSSSIVWKAAEAKTFAHGEKFCSLELARITTFRSCDPFVSRPQTFLNLDDL